VATLAILGAWSNGFMYANWPEAAWKVTLLATGIVWVPCRLMLVFDPNYLRLGMDL
jgi:hypothetical protein